MAHVFSNTDGSIGTIILVSATDAERFVPENGIYHGDLEIPAHDYPAALRHANGAIKEDHNEVKKIKLAEIEERHEMLRLEIRNELHEAHLEDEDLAPIRAKATDLGISRDAVVAELNKRMALSTIKNVNHLDFDHNGHNLDNVVVPPSTNIGL